MAIRKTHMQQIINDKNKSKAQPNTLCKFHGANESNESRTIYRTTDIYSGKSCMNGQADNGQRATGNGHLYHMANTKL